MQLQSPYNKLSKNLSLSLIALPIQSKLRAIVVTCCNINKFNFINIVKYLMVTKTTFWVTILAPFTDQYLGFKACCCVFVFTKK